MEVKGDSDLSREVERAVSRQPLDRVKCVRVFERFYRCNWWAPSPAPGDPNRSFSWGVSTTHVIRQSMFLDVSVKEGQLVYREVVLGRP
jgi:hypothetical protein